MTDAVSVTTLVVAAIRQILRITSRERGVDGGEAGMETTERDGDVIVAPALELCDLRDGAIALTQRHRQCRG